MDSSHLQSKVTSPDSWCLLGPVSMFSTFLFPRCLSPSLPPKVYEDSLSILCIKSQGYWSQCIGYLLQNQKGGCQCLELALRNHSVKLWMSFLSKTLIDVIVTACNSYAITCSKSPKKQIQMESTKSFVKKNQLKSHIFSKTTRFHILSLEQDQCHLFWYFCNICNIFLQPLWYSLENNKS